MQKTFEIAIGTQRGPNISYAMSVDLCHEARLVSVEATPGFAGATNLAFLFTVPEEVKDRWFRGQRSFEVRFVEALDKDFYPAHVRLAEVDDGLFIFENRDYEAEMASVDTYEALLSEALESEPEPGFQESARELVISREREARLHFEDDPLKTVARIRIMDSHESGNISLDVGYEHSAAPGQIGFGQFTELANLRIGAIEYVPDVVARPVFEIRAVDLEGQTVTLLLDARVALEH